MTEFTDQYRDLLIKQYWEKPKARAEIEMKAARWESVYQWLASFLDEFDLDQATGDRLDIIGRLVGIRREVPFVVARKLFGFAENTDARTMGDKFREVVTAGPFSDKFERQYTSLQLDDNDYRFFIRAKVARNAGSAYMVSDTKISIQDVINTAFNGNAYVVDRKDMTLALYVSPEYDLDQIRAIRQLGLLPRPQGVSYSIIIQASPGETFGFSDNPNAQGFGDKLNPTGQTSRFAIKVLDNG